MQEAFSEMVCQQACFSLFSFDFESTSLFDTGRQPFPFTVLLYRRLLPLAPSFAAPAQTVLGRSLARFPFCLMSFPIFHSKPQDLWFLPCVIQVWTIRHRINLKKNSHVWGARIRIRIQEKRSSHDDKYSNNVRDYNFFSLHLWRFSQSKKETIQHRSGAAASVGTLAAVKVNVIQVAAVAATAMSS